MRVTKPNVQFIYDGDKLITEVGPYYKLDFLYDENGQLYGFVKDNTAKYFYIRDVLGNILGIINSLGVVVAKYSYTAYGTPTITLDTDSIGSLNPFRFKGYYYDTESQMYYCNARYYVPQWGRWLTPDSADYLQYDSITGFNTFAYCNGNPVMYADPSGHMPEWAMWLTGALVIAGLAIATIATGGAAGGVAGFILSGALKGAVIGAVSSSLVEGVVDGIASASDGGDFWSGFASGAAHGFMSGAIIGGITGAISSSVQVYNASKLWANTGNKTAYRQMVDHYGKHVIQEGQKSVAKNIVNYSKQASQFFINNSSSGQLIRQGVVKISGAPGGIFNTSGLIRSFWYI